MISTTWHPGEIFAIGLTVIDYLIDISYHTCASLQYLLVKIDSGGFRPFFSVANEIKRCLNLETNLLDIPGC